MQFIKMHGAGNDYVFVDCLVEPPPADLSGLARRISDRHRGVGGDGLILICPSSVADARMRMFNADGSEAEMCGNGIRCMAKYLHEQGLVPGETLTIETGRGVLDLRLELEEGQVKRVRVNMGSPVLTARDIPTTLPGDPPVLVRLPVAGRGLEVTCVSMGNPHCVVFVEELSEGRVRELGPVIEQHPAFPNRVNVGFAQVLSPRELNLQVWERGAGQTQACGTGACAAVVAGVLSGKTGREAVCHLPGGDLAVEWTEPGDVWLTGPAVEVFRGFVRGP